MQQMMKSNSTFREMLLKRDIMRDNHQDHKKKKNRTKICTQMNMERMKKRTTMTMTMIKTKEKVRNT